MGHSITTEQWVLIRDAVALCKRCTRAAAIEYVQGETVGLTRRLEILALAEQAKKDREAIDQKLAADVKKLIEEDLAAKSGEKAEADPKPKRKEEPAKEVSKTAE